MRFLSLGLLVGCAPFSEGVDGPVSGQSDDQAWWLGGSEDGSPDDPFRIDEFPARLEGDTRDSAVRTIDQYACSSSNQSGAEVWYEIDVTAAGNFSASVTMTSDGDVDLNLLSARTADSCLARGDRSVSGWLEPGTYYLVVDTFVRSSGEERAGAYVLDIQGTNGSVSTGEYVPMAGDVIFQTSTSSQSAAIQAVTGSRYSHVGIIGIVEGHAVVFEAVQPVKTTPLSAWIDRGVNNHYAVMRHEDRDSITNVQWDDMFDQAASWIGRDYDLDFNWSDDELYCSELVYKLYDDNTNLSVGSTGRLRDYLDVCDPDLPWSVKNIVQARWPEVGQYIDTDNCNAVYWDPVAQWTLNERMIAPSDIFEHDEMVLVYSN